MQHSRKHLRRYPRKSTLSSVDADIFAHLKAEELSELAGVTLSTARRWRQRKALPEPVRRLLEVTALGRLDILGWKGWRIIDGELLSPEGWAFGPGEVMSLRLLRMQVRELERERRAWIATTPQPEPSDADERLEGIRRSSS
jgi:hypothetical protein